MKLLRYRVTNFRSVKDSGWIDCDQVTTLVGINESGKSNLLLALWKLNPVREGKIDILHDLPVSELSVMRENIDSTVFVEAEFFVDSSDATAISEKANCNCQPNITVTVRRYYNGNYEIDFGNNRPKANSARKKKEEESTEVKKFTDEGLVVSSPTAEDEATLPWEYIYKVVAVNNYIYIFSNRVNAYIIPKEFFGDKYDVAIDFMKSHVDDYKLSIKAAK